MKTESQADPSNSAKEMKHDRKTESKQTITYVQIVFNNNSNITQINFQIHLGICRYIYSILDLLLMNT